MWAEPIGDHVTCRTTGLWKIAIWLQGTECFYYLTQDYKSKNEFAKLINCLNHLHFNPFFGICIQIIINRI